MQPKPLAPYYGGKSGRLGQIIASRLPPHRVYCEPFSGMAAVLMSKKPSPVEVINDLHNGIVTLFRVVRNPEKCKELARLLNLTPYARAEWRDCNSSWETEQDELEKARKVYVTLSQNFVGVTANGSWSFGGVKYDSNVSTEFYKSIKNIEAVSHRLQGVVIENAPALNIMRQWDGPDTVMYLDPPYLMETRGRKSNDYKHELTDQEHHDLLAWCLSAKSKVILSGYYSELYANTLEGAGWVREDYRAMASSAMQTLANGLKGKPAELAKRTECLWFSPNAKPLTLWDLQEIG